MKIEPLIKKNKGTCDSPALPSSKFGPGLEFEHLLEWARLGSAHARKNVTCVEKHRQNLMASVETEKRLGEMDDWRKSPAFTEPEKAALSLSEILSLHEPEKELSPLVLEDARCHFCSEEIVCLTVTIMAVNDWIDLQA